MPPNQQNPYDFLYDKPQKRSLVSLIPTGGGSTKRLLLAIGAGAIVIILLLVVIAQVFGSHNDYSLKLTNLAQEQNEIIRIATDAGTNASSSTTLNYAATVKSTFTSDQSQVITYLAKRGTKLKLKTLNATASSATTQTLASATQAGTYDSTAMAILEKQVAAYHDQIFADYKTAIPSEKVLLTALYTNANKILANQPPITSS